jgi:hypothetical protein
MAQFLVTAAVLLAAFVVAANRQAARCAAEARRVRRLYENRRVIGGGLMALAAIAAAPGQADAQQQQLKVSRSDCNQVVKYRQPAGVAYQPGVDATGRQVASADLAGGIQVQPRTEFTIDLTLDLQNRFGVPTNPNRPLAQANVGQITVRGDKAYFDGQPLTDEGQDALAQLCQQQFGQ